MESEKSLTSKRVRKAPTRFEVWVEGDPHTPMAVRQQKSEKKKVQKKFRQMRQKKVSAEAGSVDVGSVGVGSSGSGEGGSKEEVKIPKKMKKVVQKKATKNVKSKQTD